MPCSKCKRPLFSGERGLCTVCLTSLRHMCTICVEWLKKYE